MDKKIEKLKLNIEVCRKKLQDELSGEMGQDARSRIIALSQELDKLIVEYEQLLKDLE